MAAPTYTYRSVGTVSGNTGSDPGQPSPKDPGNLLVMWAACRAGAETFNGPPTGWVTLQHTAGSGLAVMGRLATDDSADNVAAYDFWSASSQNRCQIACFGGDVYTDLATIVAHSANAHTNSSDLPSSALTITTDNCLVLSIGAKAKTSGAEDTMTVTDPAQVGTRISYSIGPGGFSTWHIWNRVQQTTAANIASGTWDQSTNNNTTYANVILALKTASTLDVIDATNPMNVGSVATITGSGFGTSGATATVGSAVQTINSQTDTLLTINSVSVGTQKFGLYDLVVTAGGLSVTFENQIQLLPRLDGRNYIDLTVPYAAASGRLTTTTDLVAGDQIEWSFVAGTAMTIADVGVASDAAFSCMAAVTEFQFRANDGTGWGTLAVQTIQDPPVTTVAVPLIEGVSAVTGEGFLAGAGLVVGVVTNTTTTNPAVYNTITDQSPDAGVVVSVGSAVNYTLANTLLAVVPLIEGQTPAGGDALITGAGLVKGIVTAVSTTNPAIYNTITDQSPDAATVVSLGTVVNYTLASVLLVTVPFVESQDVTVGSAALTAAGFGVIQSPQVSALPHNQIISQSPAGNTLAAYGSNVTIYVAAGTVVPNLFGLTAAEASAKLALVGCTVGVITHENSQQLPGRVIRQNPVAFSYTVETAIDIVLGQEMNLGARTKRRWE